MSDDVQLEARLEEQEAFDPPESFVEQANVSDPAIYDEFEENWPEAWERAADLLRRAGEAASEDAEPESDEHGDASYKENMVRVLTQRALADALERAGTPVGGN